MKKKSFNKRLILNKEKVSNLNLDNVKGGIPVTQDKYCFTKLDCTFNDCDSKFDYSCMIACWPI